MKKKKDEKEKGSINIGNTIGWRGGGEERWDNQKRGRERDKKKHKKGIG